MKPEIRSYKNVLYELSKTKSGHSFFIPTLDIRSEPFEKKGDAISEARKQIEISKLKKKFGAM
jgi:hypothetical protein